MRWKQVSIGDLTLKADSWNPKSKPNDYIDYIDLGSVDKDRKKIVSTVSYLGNEAPSRAKQLVKKDDVLVATVRPNLNGVSVVEECHDGMTASTGYCVLRPNPKELTTDYLFQWVRTPVFVKKMVDVASGANYPAVSDKKVKESKIPLPPLEEQKRIAKILDAADALRAKRRQAIAQLDTFLQSTFLDLFGDPVTNPKCWDGLELASAVKKETVVTYGIVQAGEEVENGVPYIRTGDIADSKILTKQLRKTDPEIAAKFQRSTVRKGEIVMSIRATVGTVAMIPEEIDGANLTQGTARISPGEHTIPAYLFHFIQSQGCQNWIQRQIKGATFREITLKRLRQMPVLIPPIELQQHFASIVESVEQQKSKMQGHLTQLDTLFASLQQRAFRGDL